MLVSKDIQMKLLKINSMRKLVKEFIELLKDDPKGMLQDSVAVFLIFAFCYLLLVFGSIVS